MNDYVDKNKLYKKLIYYRLENTRFLNKWFNDKKSDDDFNCVIRVYENILSTACLNILINQFEHNDSVGLFVDARTIVENFAIINAIQNNHLSDNQMAIAVLSGLYKSSARFIYFQANELENNDKELDALKNQTIKPIIKSACGITGLSEKNTEKILKDQFGFLKLGTKSKKITCYSFIEKELDYSHAEFWRFCNINSHPVFYSEAVSESVFSYFEKGLSTYFIMVDNYFKNDCVPFGNINSYFENKNNLNSSKLIDDIGLIEKTFNQEFLLTKEHNYFAHTFLEIKKLLIDVLLVKNFVSIDSAYSRFKTIFEYASIPYHIKKTKSSCLWNKLSDIRMYNLISDDIAIIKTVDIKDIIKFFNETHPNVEFSDDNLENTLLNDLFYFVYGKKMSFMEMVDAPISDVSDNYGCKRFIYSTYQYNLCEAHTSFNMTKYENKYSKNEYKISNAGYKALYFYMLLIFEKYVGEIELALFHEEYVTLFMKLISDLR